MKSPRPQLSHALYLDQTPTGSPRISVTQARRGRRGGGRRIMSLTGHQRDLAYPHLSTILWNCHGRRLRTVADDLPPGEYHPVSETAAIPMLLLMDAVKPNPIPPKPSAWRPPSPICTPAKAPGGGLATATAAAPAKSCKPSP